jgi:hypothetical protein
MGNAGGRAAGCLDDDLNFRIGAASAPDATKRVRAIRGASQPTVRQALRARSGSRSAMTETTSPAIVGTWFRNIEPNLPAPIRPTRTGFPAVARWCSRRWRFMAYSAATLLTEA